jgi:hypothetical protein
MNIAELRPGEELMKYKSIYALRREQREISVWFDDELERFDRVSDLAKAVLYDDRDILAKALSPELGVAKADVAGIEAEYGSKLDKDSLRDLLPTWRLAKIMSERQRRSEALDEDERRSRRLNEAWHSLPPYGPWSTVH